ncbi:hypothetical protein, partial [Streptomyces sp900116325]|uniref:hypothetical protein n=1 Tax=Streptomyces sp. 900116325 TaxID=3154295 RepID=UPI0033A3170F
AAAVAVSTVTRVRLGCLGRRWDATKASSFFLDPPTGLWGEVNPRLRARHGLGGPSAATPDG